MRHHSQSSVAIRDKKLLVVVIGDEILLVVVIKDKTTFSDADHLLAMLGSFSRTILPC